MTQRTAAPRLSALGALLEIAQSHKPNARQAANFLLAWWHAPSCGAFDVQDLRQMGAHLGELVALALPEIAGAGSPQASPLAGSLKELIARWRAGSEIGSLGTWQAPALGVAPELSPDELRALQKLVKAAEGSPYRLTCTRFLAAWHDASTYGGFDPAAIVELRPDLRVAMQTVVRLISRSRCRPSATGYGDRIAAVAQGSHVEPETISARHKRLMGAITGTTG